MQDPMTILNKLGSTEGQEVSHKTHNDHQERETQNNKEPNNYSENERRISWNKNVG
jgi:hypothetical protein